MKKIISIVLTLVLVFGMTSASFADSSRFVKSTAITTNVSAAGLTDIKGHKNIEAIQILYDLGIITGYENKTFAPDKFITRGEVVTMLVKTMFATPTVSYVTQFTDVPYTSWVRPYVDCAYANGIINGYSLTEFGVNDPITYDQIAAILTRALGYKANALVGTYPENSNYVAMMLGLFDKVAHYGNVPATRAEVAQMIYNTFECYMVTPLGNGNFNRLDKKFFDTLEINMGTQMLVSDQETFGDEVYTFKKDGKKIVTDVYATERVEAVVGGTRKVVVDEETITLGKDVEVYVNGVKTYGLTTYCAYEDAGAKLPVSLIYKNDELVRVVQFVLTDKGFVEATTETAISYNLVGDTLYYSDFEEGYFGSVVDTYGSYATYVSNARMTGIITKVSTVVVRNAQGHSEVVQYFEMNNGEAFTVDSDTVNLVLADVSVGNVVTVYYDYAGEVYAICDYTGYYKY